MRGALHFIIPKIPSAIADMKTIVPTPMSVLKEEPGGGDAGSLGPRQDGVILHSGTGGQETRPAVIFRIPAAKSFGNEGKGGVKVS